MKLKEPGTVTTILYVEDDGLRWGWWCRRCTDAGHTGFQLQDSAKRSAGQHDERRHQK